MEDRSHLKLARDTMPGNAVEQAIALLDVLGSRATPGSWTNTHGYGDFGWGVTDLAPRGGFGVETEDSDQGRYDSTWIATASPSLAAPLADLLREAIDNPDSDVAPYARAVAQALLGNDLMLSHLPEFRGEPSW